MEIITQIQASIDTVLQPILIVMLLGTGIFLTFKLRFLQFRKFKHGIDVARGKYDDPNDPGDVSHFQALTTALSATVGIGNIAGVAIAIHFGGPGALFWMWMTAFLGMVTKYSEVTLALNFRSVEESQSSSVSGGPMYYIEKGLGKKWKPMAMFVAFFLMLTAILNGNAIQANTIADLLNAEFNTPHWIIGSTTAFVVGAVILGGIKRIGKVTSIIAPVMGIIYVLGGLTILGLNSHAILPSIKLIFTEAFNPTAGVAGTGVGIFLQTMLWGVRRGLFSNEAGQGSASIAHAAAKTKEPVSEGVVALLEPFIDTLIICTITGLVILSTDVWREKIPTQFDLSSGDAVYEMLDQSISEYPNAAINIRNGIPAKSELIAFKWHEVKVEEFYIDQRMTKLFTGKINIKERHAVSEDGRVLSNLFGLAVENGAPLTQQAFTKSLGRFGSGIIILSVLLFGISTSISWCYYGDRCIYYLGGEKWILPYKIVFIVFHFVGAITSLNFIWNLGDTTLSLVTIPNVFALLLLSGLVAKLTNKYFDELEEGVKD